MNKKYIVKYKYALLDLLKDENINLSDIDTSNMIDMSYLFQDSKRKNFDGIETWNVSNVTDMKYMFNNALYFNKDLTSWNIEKLKEFEEIFDDSFKHVKTILMFYNACKDRKYKKKLQTMLECLDIKEVYIELNNDKINYKKNKEFIKKLENVYYDELDELIKKRQ